MAVADNDAPNVFWTRRLNGRPERSGLDASLYDALSLQATRDLGSALAVRYTLGGTAACGTDYRIDGAVCGERAAAAPARSRCRPGPLGSSLVEFPLVEFPIAVIDDGVADSGETIAVTLVDGAEYNLGGNPFTATMTIYDDTGPAAYSVAGAPRVGGRPGRPARPVRPGRSGRRPRRRHAPVAAEGRPVRHRWRTVVQGPGGGDAGGAGPTGCWATTCRPEVTYVDGSGRSTLGGDAGRRPGHRGGHSRR